MTDDRVFDRARKLLRLYRGGIGGERDKSGNLLRALLIEHALTLADIEPGLPRSTDPEQALSWREADTWLARLGSEAEPDALTHLVDAEKLSLDERARVIARMSLARLAESRADAWLHTFGDDLVTPEHVAAAAAELADDAVAAHDARTIAEAVRDLSLPLARELARPERRLTARDDLHATFLARLCQGVSGLSVRVHATPDGSPVVVARLGGNELARVRSLAHANEGRLREALRRAAITAADTAVKTG